MINKIQSTPNPTIEDVKNRFAAWRETRKKRTVIPAELWRAAVDLAPRYPTNRIAKELRLNYSSLQSRINACKKACPPESLPQPAFVELEFKQSAPPAATIVEMEDNNGNRMTIRFQSHTCADLESLTRIFWDRKP